MPAVTESAGPRFSHLKRDCFLQNNPAEYIMAETIVPKVRQLAYSCNTFYNLTELLIVNSLSLWC